MSRSTVISRVASCIAIWAFIVACGPALGPDRIPQEYAGKSFAELSQLATSPSYNDLLQEVELHKGKLVYYQGIVAQVLDPNPKTYQLRSSLTTATSDSEHAILLYSLERGPRLVEGDRVEFVGIFKQTGSVETLLGGSRVVPFISVIQARMSSPDAAVERSAGGELRR